MATQNHPLPVAIGDLYKADSIFQMPLYQRSYCWSTKKELPSYKKDLERIFETATNPDTEDEQIFLGAIILQKDANNSAVVSDRYTVIDGQQRLTTIFLTLAAMAQYSYDKGFKELSEALIKKYLVSDGANTKNFPKLEPTNLDRKQINNILKDLFGHRIKINPGSGKDEGSLTAAYKYIRYQIVEALIKDMDKDETEATFESFMTVFLNKFVIADITLSSSHNPNEVFDRLNTKGVKLGVIDLIRNNLFKPYGQDQEKCEIFYESYWLEFENRLKVKHKDTKNIESQVDNFFFPYALNQNNAIAKNSMIDALGKLWKNKTSSTVVEDMMRYIPSYFAVIGGEHFKDRIPTEITGSLREALVNLHQFSVPQSSYPFLIRCVLEVLEGRLNPDVAAESLRIVESFFVRRAFVFDEEGSGYHAIFKRLWEDTKGLPNQVKEKIHTTTKAFPLDREFETAICTKPVYGKNNRKISSYAIRRIFGLDSLRGLSKQSYSHFRSYISAIPC